MNVSNESNVSEKEGVMKEAPKRRITLSETLLSAFILGMAAIIASIAPGYQDNKRAKEAAANEYAEKTVLNSHERDLPLIHLMNISEYGHGNANWKRNEVGDVGDQIGVIVYYNNNGSETAFNTRMKLSANKCNGDQGCWRVCARLWAKNTNDDVNDCAFLTTQSNSKLMFSGGVRWRIAKSESGDHLFPNSQTGYEIISKNGILLGDIGSSLDRQTSFDYQGTVVANYVLSNLPRSGNIIK